MPYGESHGTALLFTHHNKFSALYADI